MRALAIFAAIAVLVLGARAARADGSASPVVARVGSHVITVAELEHRLAQVPPFQLRTLGKTPDEIRRTYLEKAIIREILLSDGAIDAKLDQRPDVQERMRRTLSSVMLGRLRFDSLNVAPPNDAEVKAYYEANQSKFHTPARIAVWRIQVGSEAAAREVIASLATDATPKHWSDIAREKSLDKLTNMRGGNLGFISPDGSTSEQGVKVEPAIYEAAAKVQDGAIVPEPVKDGERYSVVWRRQSMRAVDRSLEDESSSIKQIIAHQKSEDRIQATMDDLRQKYRTEWHPELVDALEIAGTGEIGPGRRPGTLAPSRKPLGSAQPVPRETPGGMR